MTESDRTKGYIVRATLKLMEEKPLDKITVREIADKAGVGRASFYRNFRSKADVVRHYLNEGSSSFLAGIDFIPRTKGDYHDMIMCLLGRIEQKRDVFDLLVRSGLEKMVFDYVLDVSARIHGAYPEQSLARFYASGYGGAIAAVIYTWLQEGCATPPEAIATVVLGILFPHEDERTRLQYGAAMAFANRSTIR